MTFKPAAFKCAALLVALAFAGHASARPEGTTAATAVGVQQQIAAATTTQPGARAPYDAAARNPHETHHQQHHHQHGKLSIVRLVLIIGKVIAPLVGAIVEPLLVNIVRGVTWAITYTLATGFGKPLSYEHFVPALHHHGGGGGDEYEEGDHEYDSHKPVTYALDDLPGMALRMTSTLLSKSRDRPEYAEAVEDAEEKLVGLMSRSSEPAPSK